jgi:hypothetical protein
MLQSGSNRKERENIYHCYVSKFFLDLTNKSVNCFISFALSLMSMNKCVSLFIVCNFPYGPTYFNKIRHGQLRNQEARANWFDLRHIAGKTGILQNLLRLWLKKVCCTDDDDDNDDDDGRAPTLKTQR